MTARNHILAGALAALLAAGPAVAHEIKAGSLEIGQPWSRATPGGAKVAAGYVTIGNTGDAPDRLLSATAEIAGRTEIHEMSTKDGVMTMRPQPDGVPVPAKGEAKLAPGGLHLMFMDLKRPLKQGETFRGALTFEAAGEVPVEFSVQPIGAAAPAEGHMEHGAMDHGPSHADHGSQAAD